jgi:hypothetical protein
VTQGPIDPKRLTVVGATDLERTLLQAARRERPSPEQTARMAAGLGISIAAATSTAAAATAAAAAPAAVVTTTTAWISAGVVAVAVAATVVGVRLSAAPHGAGKAADRAAPAAIAPPAPRAEEPPIAVAAVPAGASVAAPADRKTDKIHRRAATPAPAADLRDQIALIDAARTAVKAGATDRALALLRRYDATYPGGAFRPEALALRIEALDHGGRGAEAQALAREFLARYPQSPVADRVARIVQKR